MRLGSYRAGGPCTWHAVTRRDTEKGGGRDGPFYTNERGDLATPRCADDVVCGERKFKRLVH